MEWRGLRGVSLDYTVCYWTVYNHHKQNQRKQYLNNGSKTWTHKSFGRVVTTSLEDYYWKARYKNLCLGSQGYFNVAHSSFIFIWLLLVFYVETKKSRQSSIVQKVDSMILHMAENKNLLNGVWLLMNTDHVCWTCWKLLLVFKVSYCVKMHRELTPCLSTLRKSILYSVFSFECS